MSKGRNCNDSKCLKESWAEKGRALRVGIPRVEPLYGGEKNGIKTTSTDDDQEVLNISSSVLGADLKAIPGGGL